MLWRVIAKTSSSIRRQLPDLAAANSRLSSWPTLLAPSVFFDAAASASLVDERSRPMNCTACRSTRGRSFGQGWRDGGGRGGGGADVVANDEEQPARGEPHCGREPGVRDLFVDAVGQVDLRELGFAVPVLLRHRDSCSREGGGGGGGISGGQGYVG